MKKFTSQPIKNRHSYTNDIALKWSGVKKTVTNIQTKTTKNTGDMKKDEKNESFLGATTYYIGKKTLSHINL